MNKMLKEKEQEKKTCDPENIKRHIKQGLSYIRESLFAAKEYFKQAGLSDKQVDLLLDSSEFNKLKDDQLTETEKKEALMNFYKSLIKDYQGKFQKEIQEAAKEELESLEKE